MSDYQKLRWVNSAPENPTEFTYGHNDSGTDICPLGWGTCLMVWKSETKQSYIAQHRSGIATEAQREFDFYDFVNASTNLIEDWLEEVHAYLRGQDARR